MPRPSSVIDERPAGTTKLMIEIDTGGKGKSLTRMRTQVSPGCGRRERSRESIVFAGPKHDSDPLADGSKNADPSPLIGTWPAGRWCHPVP